MPDTRQPYDPEFTAWMARGMDESTLAEWEAEARRIALEQMEEE